MSKLTKKDAKNAEMMSKLLKMVLKLTKNDAKIYENDGKTHIHKLLKTKAKVQ